MILWLVMSRKNVYYAAVLALLLPAYGEFNSSRAREEIMSPARLIFSMSVSMFLSFSSCSKENKSSAQNADKPPADFRLVFGRGGGFTGMWQGHTVDSSGTIYSWQGKMAGENLRSIGQLSSKQ